VACFMLLGRRGCGTAAAAAVEVDGRVFVGTDAFDAFDDLVVRNVDRALQVAGFEFFFGTYVNPYAFCFGRLRASGFGDGRGKGYGGRQDKCGGSQRGSQQFFHGRFSKRLNKNINLNGSAAKSNV